MIIITFLAPPDGVPIDPIIVPYATEKRVSSTAFFPSVCLVSIFFTTDKPIGSMIAMIVCSPKKDERIAEIVINPARNNLLLLPNNRIITLANRISNP